MKRTPTLSWQPPVTYAAFVAEERRRHESRLKRFEQARKMIVALEPDLARLRDMDIIVSIEPEYGLIVDCREDVTIGRAVNAIRLDTGIFSETRDRAVHALSQIGYVFERPWRGGYPAGVIFRQPKTQKRLVAPCSPECLAALQTKEAA